MRNDGKVFMQTEVIQLSAEQTKQLITEAVVIALKESCTACPLPLEAREEVTHAFGMVKDIGDNSVRKGIETIRYNHEFVIVIRKAAGKLANKVFMTIIGVALTGLGAAIFLGVKAWIKIHSG